MIGELRLPEASAYASELDWLLIALLLVSVAVLALVFGLGIYYIARYRHTSDVYRGGVMKKTWGVETGWTAATLFAFFGLFIWGANLYARLEQPPFGGNVLRISVIGKQWMWKVEYPGGQHEIDALHVPLGRPVELLMTSEDVIHDVAIPAFRIRHDVLPGRYEALAFTATKVGNYHLFCDQLCGTDHSSMVGVVTVMTPGDYTRWLAANAAPEGLAEQGKKLFVSYGCSGCHSVGAFGGGGTVRAPPLVGVYGHPVPLADGTVVVADDQYIRDSILMPSRQIVASYENKMPSFAGIASEEDLIRLVAFIKSLGAGDGT
jgi:cytochrome c oxidase subunit 2